MHKNKLCDEYNKKYTTCKNCVHCWGSSVCTNGNKQPHSDYATVCPNFQRGDAIYTMTQTYREKMESVFPFNPFVQGVIIGVFLLACFIFCCTLVPKVPIMLLVNAIILLILGVLLWGLFI